MVMLLEDILWPRWVARIGAVRRSRRAVRPRGTDQGSDLWGHGVGLEREI